MKKKSIRKFAPNTKTTTIKCINCPQSQTGKRSHMKFCGHTCCVQDGNSRREKGYTKKVFTGDREGLTNFLLVLTNLKIQDHFTTIRWEINSAAKDHDKNVPWKLESTYFRLNYFPNIKKKCFEVYLVDEKYKILKRYEVAKKLKNIKFKHVIKT